MNALLTPLLFALLHDQLPATPQAELVRGHDGRLVVSGADFAARFDAAGLEFEGAGGATLQLGAVELRRGADRLALAPRAPSADGARATFERAPGVLEHFEATSAGIEHSLVVEGPFGVSGDLVVRVELGGANAELGERLADGSHHFGDVTYGHLFGIDADGDRVDGDVRLVDGGFELVLPADFVDAADWPITLDPLIGSGSSMSQPSGIDSAGLGERDYESDAAYDATTGWYLSVWRRQIVEPGTGGLGAPPTLIKNRVMYRRLNSDGGAVGAPVSISGNNSFEPRIASVNRNDAFAVTWLENVGSETRLMFRAFAAATGVPTGAAIEIASDDLGEIEYHDVAGESSPSILVSSRAFVVWLDGNGVLKLTRVSVPSASAPTIVDTTTIAADPGIFDSWGDVSISRCTNSEGRMVVALERYSALSNFNRISALTIDRAAAVITAPSTISGSDIDATNPSIDGGGSAPSRWVVAWDNDESTWVGGYFELHAVALTGTASPSPNTLTAGAVVTHANAGLEFRPSVGWRNGMAVVASNADHSIAVRMLCDATAQIGELASTVYPASFLFGSEDRGERAVVALRSSGGNTTATEGMILWRRVNDDIAIELQSQVWRRMYNAFDPNATTSILALGCGNVGAIGVPTPPAIGNADFRVELSGAKPGAAIAILNIAAPQPLATCGSCTFAALGTLHVMPIVGGEAVKNLPIPCNPSLAGVQADVQWIVYEPGVVPCAAVPDFGVTGLLRLTLN